MAPVDQIFAIHELLEMILLQLPERDLLLSQRVNTTWRNVTKTSPHLQRKLWYKVDLCDLASIYDLKWNPLKSNLSKYARITLVKTEIDTGEKTKASWNDMILTRPAVRGIYVDLFKEDFGLDVAKQAGIVENQNGVTMGDIRSAEWVDKYVSLGCAGSTTIACCWISRKPTVSRRRYSPSLSHQTDN